MNAFSLSLRYAIFQLLASDLPMSCLCAYHSICQNMSFWLLDGGAVAADLVVTDNAHRLDIVYLRPVLALAADIQVGLPVNLGPS